MKDALCPYYTDADDITGYMVKKLSLKAGDRILEPSAGEGDFLDEILKSGVEVEIDAVDISDKAVAVLKEKYSARANISVRCADTLLDEKFDSICEVGGMYDCVIGNPPYGAWQEYERRSLLKEKYAGYYVKETYTLFLLRSFSLLKTGGRLSFIVPDTFLFLNTHEKLRTLLLNNSKIAEILIFPSRFFPGVSFGYSNLSIITLEKCGNDQALEHIVRVIRGFESSSQFHDIQGNIDHLQVFYLRQADVAAGMGGRFVLSEKAIDNLLKSNVLKLGDVADVVTGFYTGDNARFIRVKSKHVKNAKNYEVADRDKIFECEWLNGIPDIDEGYIPYIKCSSAKKYIPSGDEWYVRWDEPTIEFFKSNKKSRFQNSRFYFKEGIGIPMVKSKEVKAFYMKGRIFDQAIVGIFPKDPSKILYVLALMNSDIVNELIHIINPTANNSANYIKQIPYIEPDERTLRYIMEKVAAVLDSGDEADEDVVASMNEEISNIIGDVYSEYMVCT